MSKRPTTILLLRSWSICVSNRQNRLKWILQFFFFKMGVKQLQLLGTQSKKGLGWENVVRCETKAQRTKPTNNDQYPLICKLLTFGAIYIVKSLQNNRQKSLHKKKHGQKSWPYVAPIGYTTYILWDPIFQVRQKFFQENCEILACLLHKSASHYFAFELTLLFHIRHQMFIMWDHPRLTVMNLHQRN